MSGTSADGVDAALVRVEGRGLELRARAVCWCTEPFCDELRRAVLSDMPTAVELAGMHAQVAEACAKAARNAAQQGDVPLGDVLAIGCHGQTVWHAPSASPPTTLQLGAPAIVAERTGVTVVSDFRWRDVAAGGQGAPLVALVDWLLLRDPRRTRLAVNLGGTVNVTYLPAGCAPEQVVAFDVGPGNVLLDALAVELTEGRQPFDRGGRLAVQGRQQKALLRHWAAHEYLSRPPPKSTGREEFGDTFVRESLELAARKGWTVRDMLCTATHFVASCLADAVSRFLPARPPIDQIVVSGGGVHNGFLLRTIGERFRDVPLVASDEFNLAVDAKEAIAFGVLACLTLDRTPANVPSATGAAGPRVLGSLTPGTPENWRRVARWLAG